jgi:hypothetical protein
MSCSAKGIVLLYTGSYVDAWEKRQSAARRRRELRDRAITHLGGSCRICGYNKCPSAFDFHHINALEKDFTISSRMTSWEAIERELGKCVLLCSNCHREVHDGLHPSYIEDESHMRGQIDDRQVEMFDEDITPADPPQDLLSQGA